MRWAGDTQRWGRPRRGIVAVFDGMALKGGLQMGEGRQVPIGATTHGHRFLAPAVFDVIGFEDYRVQIANATAMLDPPERRKLIAEPAAGRAKNAGVTVKCADALPTAVDGLLRWPQVRLERLETSIQI